jgi:hypothetical protein
MLFDDDDAGNVTMTGTVLNDFVIDAAIDLNADCSQIANVTITTTSTTDVDGSGSGSVAAGQTLVLDTVTAPNPPSNPNTFNVTYVGAGNVNCSVTGGSPLILCPLANLMAGDNALPQSGDPLARLWPDIEFIDNGGTLTWQFAGGKTVATGWSLNAPLDLASAGTQFIFFEGSQ